MGQRPVPKGQQFQLTVTTVGRLTDPDQFADIILKGVQDSTQSTTGGNATSGNPTTGSSPTSTTTNQSGTSPNNSSTGIVRLRDVVARYPDGEKKGQPKVERGAQQYDQSCTLNGKPSVALCVYQLPGSNALETADGVYAKMKDLKTRFPDGLDYKIVYDTTPFVRESVNEVFITLRDAVILVAIVVLLFLQDWRAMILPMIDVPVSLIGTFAVMSLMGFTLNSLTLFGLVLAIGIVVDDAIVVLENIERQMAMGLDARTATIKAMEEITGPVLAITLVLCAVFIPCCFLGGITGQFFRQFAVTIAVSTLISAINALTMTPSRAVLIFKDDGEHKPGQVHQHKREALPWWIFAVVGGYLTAEHGPEWAAQLGLRGLPMPDADGKYGDWMPWGVAMAWYLSPGVLIGGLLGWFLIRPINSVLAWCFGRFNKGFDWVTDQYGKVVSRVLRLSVIVLIGYAGLLVLTYTEFIRTPTGFIPQQDKGYLILNVQLPDSASVTAAAISAKIQERCRTDVREARVTSFGAPPVDGLGTTGGFNLIVQTRGSTNLDQLERVADQIVVQGNTTPGLEGLFTSAGANTPWLYLEIDRDKCRILGVQISEIFNTLQVYLGSFYVNNFNEFGRTWQVNVQADPRFRSQTSDIMQLQVRNGQGQMVRMGTVMTVRDTSGPVVVMRYNMYSAAAITGNPAPGTGSGEAMKVMEALAQQELARGMKYEWTELAYLQNQAGNSAMWFFLLAVVFVFLVLAAQYESWKLPLAVILVVPMCLLCSIVGVQWAGIEVTVFTQIGFVVLVGLACKNAILIVEFAKQKQEEGKPRAEATVEAASLRLRPIVMTSFAFIFGVVPLVYAEGAGFEMRRSLGQAVFSGMLGVTMFGIFLTPVFYYVLQSFGKVPSPPGVAHSEAAKGHEPVSVNGKPHDAPTPVK
ncbi:MAG: efflux RND transporter permease subunit [Planctomycetes bacterium]|nr:efflux RND transporter permease subunit [Planctomycetota bacterium]